MYSFLRYQQTSLYTSSETGSASNFFGFYLPEAISFPDEISFNESWSDYTGLYISLKESPGPEEMNDLLIFLGKNFPPESLSHSSIAWLKPIKNSKDFDVQLLALNSMENTAVAVDSNFSVEILNASFLLAAESPVIPKLEEDGSLSGLIIEYPMSASSPIPVPGKNVQIPFTRAQRACIQADITMEDDSNSSARFPKKGFYFFITKPDTPDIYQGCYYPLFTPAQQQQVNPQTVYTGYRMTYDPVDPFSKSRTRYTYAGYAFQLMPIEEAPYWQIGEVLNDSPASLSNYISVFGSPVKLLPLANSDQPASYVQLELPPGFDFPFYLAPEGDFQIIKDLQIPNIAGGLSGTELFKLDDADTVIVRFEAGNPACVKSFPFVLASPVGPPGDSLSSPFSDDYQTSWATLFKSSGEAISYVAQPRGAELYAKAKDGSGNKEILEPTDPAFSFTSDKASFFPMPPYAGLIAGAADWTMSTGDISALEEIVLSPQRRKIISLLASTNAHLLKNGLLEGEEHYATTPSGILAKTTQSTDGKAVKWDKFLLGKNGDDEIAFNEPSDEVITAMQSSDVFLVVSNNSFLPAPGFANSVSIGGWQLTANIGKNQTYGDYRNVMIFKGRKGKLYDPENESNCLIANPKKWSQAADFSIPQTTDTPDSGQLVILSNWLQTYFKNAYNQTSDYFKKFKNIAIDENWTGVLFLRVDITGTPENLSGIVAGVSNPSAFNAHHLGIEVSPVNLNDDGIPQLDKPSSFFGLIYYLDPGFTDTQPIRAIAPTTTNTYDFKLLALKVLFENTAVKGFESYAQLTLNSLFDSSVSKTLDASNIYKNVLLTGCLQINQGQPVYSLESKNDDAFYLDNNIINKVEITGAVLSSRTPANSENQRSWFGLNGFIDFKILKNQDDKAFDLFSFGNTEGEDKLRKGLNFSNLGIAMDFTKSNPAKNTLSFAAGEIRFNPAPNVSSPRPGSIYSQLHLGLESLVIGTPGQIPKDFGYLDMIPNMPLGGPGTDGWYGLRFKLNMGSPGALAGNIGLNSYLLVSWSPLSQGEQSYKAGIGIALPGSSGGGKLLSLQTVLTLSIGQIRLTQVGPDESKVFMLMFTEIALKFLGILKLPPNGNTLFYLFGDPKTNDDKGSLGWYAMYRQE